MIDAVEHGLAEIQLTQKLVLLEQRYFTWNIPLLTPIHIFMTFVGLKAYISNTIFFDMWWKSSSGLLECHMLKSHLE